MKCQTLKKNTHSIACNPNRFIHFPWCSKRILIAPKTFPHCPASILHQKPYENPSQKLHILKREGALKELPCMNDKNLPKGPKNPCLREKNKASPGSAKISKKRKKKKLVPAEIFQKGYPWKTRRLRKEMV
ncbi:hypothetical protein AAC387_Pa04g1244 [Persea americana]